MNQLTQEQIKILEDAFASYSEDSDPPSEGKFISMQGIQDQLEELNGKPGVIFYITHENMDETSFAVKKMKIGEQQ